MAISYDYRFLQRSDFPQTKEAIPDELLDKLIASRVANAGFSNLRQVTFATFDQIIHRQEVSTCAAMTQLTC